MNKYNWTETEQMKVVWNIVDSELIFTTKNYSDERKRIVDGIETKLKGDPDFSLRLGADYPENTIRQHILAWIRYLEGGDVKPPLVG